MTFTSLENNSFYGALVRNRPTVDSEKYIVGVKMGM